MGPAITPGGLGSSLLGDPPTAARQLPRPGSEPATSLAVLTDEPPPGLLAGARSASQSPSESLRILTTPDRSHLPAPSGQHFGGGGHCGSHRSENSAFRQTSRWQVLASAAGTGDGAG